MLLKELGTTGVKIPEVGLGTWDYHAGPGPLRRGLAAGALFVDTAESYGTEPVVAAALEGMRDRVFLATKVSRTHFRRADVLKAADESLLRLRTDRIDLYQLHEPNEAVPFEETLGAMEDLVDAGKVRFIGVSNFSVEQLQRAERVMRKHPIMANQVRFSLVDRTISTDLLPYCQRQRMTVIAYSPLARGLHRLRDCDPHGVLAKLAQASGRSPVQVALNWCLGHEGVVVIPKGNSEAHILENCGASDWRLTDEQQHALDTGVSFRRRSRMENLLRACTPRPVKAALRNLVALAPGVIRRRIH